MTENDMEIYQKGVAYLEEWEDVNYCEHSFKFKDEWLTDREVVDLLNELHEENDVLKQQLKTKYIVNKQYKELQKVKEENERLKQQLDDNLQFIIRASKRLGFESLDHFLYTLDKGEITGYSTANWENGDVEWLV